MVEPIKTVGDTAQMNGGRDSRVVIKNLATNTFGFVVFVSLWLIRRGAQRTRWQHIPKGWVRALSSAVSP